MQPVSEMNPPSAARQGLRVDSEFSPPAWLRNPHLQTVLASKLIRPPLPPVTRERLELDDGDFLDLVHADPGSGHAAGRDADVRPTIALFHGLAGSLESSYVSGAMRSLVARGARVTLMHWRGCSGEPNRLVRSYHSGATDDIARVAELLAARYPDSPRVGLGYSLGGNALLKYLGERGEAAALDGGLAVSPPLVLSVGADTLQRGAARGYQRYLLGLMRGQHEAKRAARPELRLPPAGPSLNTFWRFDDALTAPLHGYRDVHDYYDTCSARRWLGGIRRPTHILSARDDPFFSEAILPAPSELAPGTVHEISERGGHVGFLGRGASPWRPARWLDERVAERCVGLATDPPGASAAGDARAR